VSWDFRVRGFAGVNHHAGVPLGQLLVETTHKGIASAQIEVQTWQRRIERGDASRCELIDLRPGGKLTHLNIKATSVINWQ